MKFKFFFYLILDAIKFQKHIKQDIFNEVLLWTCHDECIYHCMWRTTNTFVSRDWPVPQFYGKWPFVRFFGIQEPASVFFSFLNLIAHWRMIRKFRSEVRNDSPMYYVWHIFSAVSIYWAEYLHINHRHNSTYCMWYFFWKIDLYKWLDLFHYFPYKRLPIDWIAGLWIRLFHGISQFLLHDIKVKSKNQMNRLLRMKWLISEVY